MPILPVCRIENPETAFAKSVQQMAMSDETSHFMERVFCVCFSFTPPQKMCPTQWHYKHWYQSHAFAVQNLFYTIHHTVAHWILTFYPPFRPIIQYTCIWYVLHWHVNRVFISSPIYTHTQNDEELRFFSCDFISSVLVNSAWEVNDIVLSLLIQILIQISIASISTQRELITVLVSFWNQSVICPEYEKNRRFHVEYR